MQKPSMLDHSSLAIRDLMYSSLVATRNMTRLKVYLMLRNLEGNERNVREWRERGWRERREGERDHNTHLVSCLLANGIFAGSSFKRKVLVPMVNSLTYLFQFSLPMSKSKVTWSSSLSIEYRWSQFVYVHCKGGTMSGGLRERVEKGEKEDVSEELGGGGG